MAIHLVTVPVSAQLKENSNSLNIIIMGDSETRFTRYNPFSLYYA